MASFNLDERFTLRDGTSVAWREATAAQHQEHIDVLREQQQRALNQLDARKWRLAQAKAMSRSVRAGEEPELDENGKIAPSPEDYPR